MTKLQETMERAIQALENLEEALNSGNDRAVGAALYELWRALREIKQISEQE